MKGFIENLHVTQLHANKLITIKACSLQLLFHIKHFVLQFLPNSSDSILVTGAADCKIRVHDLNVGETTHVFANHAGRVKRCAVAPNVPFMFWSAAEDGTIM